MANFIGVSRSNYFAVEMESSFLECMGFLGLEVQNGEDSQGERTWMVYPEDGDWPTVDDQDRPIDIVERIKCWLPPGEVCILHTIGYEKLRYLNHALVAFTRDGIIQHQSQEQFYDELNRMGHKFARAES